MVYLLAIWLIIILSIIPVDIVPAYISEQAKPSPKVLFQASFDCDAKADIAEGNPIPLEAKGVQFRNGIKGRAVYIEPQGILAYAEQGNLDKQRGSIEMWVCPLFDASDKRWHGFLWEDAPFDDWTELKNVFSLWFCGDTGSVRFDIRDPKDSYKIAPARNWEPGRWHHLVATWDCESGIQLFIDGKAFAARRGNEMFSWTPAQYERFLVGSSTQGQTAEALIDELRVYNAPLSKEQVWERYYENMPLMLQVDPILLELSDEAQVNALVTNMSRHKVCIPVAFKIMSPDDKSTTLLTKRIKIMPQGKEQFRITFDARMPGLHRIFAEFSGGILGPHDEKVYIFPPLPAPAKDLHLHKLTEIDLTKPLELDGFCDDGTSRVVTSQVGAYREAGEKRFSRFAIRFRIEHPNAPHLFVVYYPDDKERCAEVSTYSPVHSDMFNAHTGYLTGGEFPVTVRTMKLPLLVFPRERDQGLVFTTWEQGKPVAASKVEIYEVEGGLPAAMPPSTYNMDSSTSERLIGLYFEDPTLSSCFGATQNSPDLADFDRAARNLAVYMRYTGLNVLFYPLAWYSGPLYASQIEDTKKSRGSDRHPPEGFVDILMERLDNIGARFFGSIWMHSLPSLSETAVYDEREVEQGVDTPLCMNKDGQLIKQTWHHRPPMFNPIHPKVKQQVLRLVDEILDRYGDYPAFAGISLHLATPCFLWWGSLDVDYGDYTVSLFERETGIEVPVSPMGPKRFTERYQWLIEHAYEKWIDWRCHKIYENIMAIAERVRNRRADLKLVLAVYTPIGCAGRTRDDAVAWDKYGRSVREYNRVVNGLDIAVFGDEESIVLTRTFYPADYRWGKMRGATPAESNISRAISFDASVTKWFHKPGACGINLHNRYFETAFGREHPLKGMWWGPLRWRASAVLPADRNFLELFSYWLSELDPAILTTGGFTVGTIGREDVLREFAAIFKQLPATGWHDLSLLVEPVRGREWIGNQSHLLYLVNHESQAISHTLSFDQSVHLKSLSSIDLLDASGNIIKLSFEPFQLRAFELKPHRGKLIGAQAEQRQTTQEVQE